MLNWVEVVWPLAASISLVFGFVHLLVWWVHKRDSAQLSLAVIGFSLAALTVLQYISLFNHSTTQFAALIRWMHVPVTILVISMLYVMHAALGGYGTRWMAMAAALLSLLALLLAFKTGVNLNFLQIDHLEWHAWWGVMVAHPAGPLNPATGVSLMSNLMLLAYSVRALASGLRQQPERRHALFRVCGAGMLFALLLMVATLERILQWPNFPLALPGLVLASTAIGWHFGSDLIRWSRLERQLQQSESHRQRSERELERAALTSGLGLWQWDVAGDGLIQNDLNRQLLACNTTAGDVKDGDHPALTRPGHDAASVLFAGLLPADVEQVRSRFDAAILQPRFDIEFPVRDAKGQPHWVCLRGSVEHDAKGTPLIVRGLTQDISRQRKVKEQLRAVLDCSPAAMLLIDPEGNIRDANQPARMIFGYGQDAMAGLPVDVLLPGVGNGEGALRLPELTQMQCQQGLRARARYGREFPVELAISPLDLEGRRHVVVTVEDLSERRRIEQEVAFERESMAHLSRVTLIGEISSSLAHELNQPLAAILSNAQAGQRLLRRNPDDTMQISEILDDIVSNDRRAGEVIHRIRGLLKKELRTHAPVVINDLIQDAVAVIKGELLNRGVRHRLELAATASRVLGDPIQLQQVVLNLVLNACDAMGEGDERIITIRTSSRRSERILVEVVDTGCGIATDSLETIFAPFHTTKPNGMGMGLAICRTIIQAHGGRIWAANRTDGGAMVCFELPMLE